MAVKVTWRVYGRPGHRMAESFNPSYVHDHSNDRDGLRILDVKNSDKTGTNEYTEISIIRDTEDDCFDEFYGQVSDGIFEDYFVGHTTFIDSVTADEAEIEELKKNSKNGRK